MRIKLILALLLASSGSLYALDQVTPNGNLSNVQPKSVIGVADHSAQWPYGVIPYTFHPSLTVHPSSSDKEKEAIKAGMEMMTRNTNVKFVPLPDQNNDGIADFGPPGYITFEKSRAGRSPAYPGWNPDGQRMVYLTRRYIDLYDTGRTAHELLHIVGFEHDHDHPDSTHHITAMDIDTINKIYHIDEDRILEGFDPKFYLEQYPDVAAVYGQNNHQGAYIHWYQYGMPEGRSPSLAYDPQYYLQTISTLTPEGGNVELIQQAQNGNYIALYMHWINGPRGGSIHFDPEYYEDKYFPRDEASQSQEFKHFNSRYYGSTYESVMIAHWLLLGRNEGRFGTLAEEQSHQTQ